MVEFSLEIYGVTHLRDRIEVLREIDLSTNAKLVGVVGRNGSGKSSLAPLLVGLDQPSTGSIRVFGGDVAADRAFALEHVGIIFQNPDQQIIFPTVGEEIRFGLENIGWSKASARTKTGQVLERFGAGDWTDKPIYTLSHGQKHLVCLMNVYQLLLG